MKRLLCIEDGILPAPNGLSLNKNHRVKEGEIYTTSKEAYISRSGGRLYYINEVSCAKRIERFVELPPEEECIESTKQTEKISV